jgi:RND family efflux transporter MFP subunit
MQLGHRLGAKGQLAVWAAVVVVVMALLAGAGAWLRMWRPPVEPEAAAAEKPRPAKPAKSQQKGERKILYWKSPMDPTYISPVPGKEPVMGMDLVPVYEGEEEAEEGGVIRIDPVAVQNIGVRTALVKRRRLSRIVRTVGRIDYDERRVRRITPKIGGWIERQYVDFTGQVVRKGEPLLDIYSPELVSTQEEYLRALKFRNVLRGSSFGEVRTGAENLVESTRTRLLFWDITEQQIRALEEKGAITKTMSLHAPFDGIIVKKEALEGDYVKPGQNLYTIADISTVWVYADIYEYEAPWIRRGQEAEMTLSYFPGQTYRGEVVYVYPYLKNMTRTLQVRMEFPNSRDFALKPDMWADVVVRSDLPRDTTAVPIEAVLRTGKRDVAFVALGDGKFAPRELRLGAEADGYYEVLEGLREHERVVTSAQFLINSESSLRSAIQKMLERRRGDATSDEPGGPQSSEAQATESEKPSPAGPSAAASAAAEGSHGGGGGDGHGRR